MADVALARRAAKLSRLGLSSWQGKDAKGWGKEEVKLLRAALDTLPALRSAGGVPVSTKPQRYCELVFVSFGEAWRRYWLFDKKLVPQKFASGWIARLR